MASSLLVIMEANTMKMYVLKKSTSVLVAFLLIVFVSCSFLSTNYDGEAIKAKEKKKQWTFIFYLAGDNELEGSLIEDLCEIEAVKKVNKDIHVIALLDRSPLHDNSNGDWSGTRLYEVISDPKGSNKNIISKQLVFPELGLYLESDTNVNTADKTVLAKTISYAKKNYPSHQYALVMGGHGTGWRSRNTQNLPMAASYTNRNRAFAIDDSSGQHMSVKSFGEAISGQGIDIVVLDTCFGALLEVAYEIKDACSYLLASESSIPLYGWNYTSFFTSFIASSFTYEDFFSSAFSQFEDAYKNEEKVSLSLIDCSKVEKVKIAFDNYAKESAKTIQSSEDRNGYLSWITQSVLSFCDYAEKTDMFIDLYSFGKEGGETFPVLEVEAKAMQESLKEAVPHSFNSFQTAGYNLGVYFASYENGVICASHPDAYVQGSGISDLSRFVKESDGWVPHKEVKDSLLDLLFYTTF